MQAETKPTVKLDNGNAFRRRRNAQIKWLMLFIVIAIVAFAYLMYNPKKAKAVLGGGKKPPASEQQNNFAVNWDDDDNENVMTTTYADYYDMFSTTFGNWQDMVGRPHYQAWDYEFTTTDGPDQDENEDEQKSQTEDKKTETVNVKVEDVAEQKMTKPEPVDAAKQIAKPDTATQPVIISKILPSQEDSSTKNTDIDIYKVTDPQKALNINFLSKYTNPCFKYGDDSIRCFPAFFIIGMPQSGTQDVYERLSSHPHIIKPERNSPSWWMQTATNQGKITLDQYLNHFSEPSKNLALRADTEEKRGKSAHEAVTFDANPSLFWKGNLDADGTFKTPANIKQILPNSKMILFVRCPVDRLYSEYKHYKPTGTKESFDKFATDAIASWKACRKTTSEQQCVHRDLAYDTKANLEVGMYSVFYEEWLKYVPQSHILVVKVEDYGKDTMRWLKTILAFLELPYASDDMIKALAEMKTTATRNISKPDMLKRTDDMLSAFYKPYSQKFAELLHDKKFDYSTGS